MDANPPPLGYDDGGADRPASRHAHTACASASTTLRERHAEAPVTGLTPLGCVHLTSALFRVADAMFPTEFGQAVLFPEELRYLDGYSAALHHRGRYEGPPFHIATIEALQKRQRTTDRFLRQAAAIVWPSLHAEARKERLPSYMLDIKGNLKTVPTQKYGTCVERDIISGRIMFDLETHISGVSIPYSCQVYIREIDLDRFIKSTLVSKRRTTPRQPQGQVSEAAMRKYIKKLKASAGPSHRLTEDEILAGAEAEFPNKKINRERMREVWREVDPRPRGRPKGSQTKPAIQEKTREN